MHSALNQHSHQHSQYIPDTLVSLIFEYLPLSDFPNVRLCNKRFNQLVQESFALWARCNFSKYIDFMMDYQLESHSLVAPWNLRNKAILYDDETEPQHIMKSHLMIKKEWDNFFGTHLSTVQKKSLLEEIFEVLRNPPAPVPRLKRDTMVFETNSVFQNFLTEVYFQLNKKCALKDQKRILLGEIIEKIQGSEENIHNLLCLNEERTEDDLSGIVSQSNNGTKLYNLIYLMVQNYCQMVRSYISSIKEPLMFLEQYHKLWNNYVLITIDLDEIFACLSDYMNGIYNKEIGSSSEVDRLAPWRVLRQVWTREVFSHVSSSLGNIINSLIANLRNPKEGEECQNEEIIYLIKDVYNATSDLSYDECTIFYWDCQSTDIETPKGELNSNILENIYKIYEQTDLLAGKNTSNLTCKFKNDKKLIKELFGKELAHYVTELQTHFLKTSLQGVFESSLKEVKNTTVPETIEDAYKPLELNIPKVMNIIDIDPKEKPQSIQRKDIQRRLGETIVDKCPLFSSYLEIVSSYEIKLRNQQRKSNEKRMKLLNSGFYPTEDKHQDSLTSSSKHEISVFG